MENHRTVLLESMKEYFTRIEHKLVGKYQMKDKKQKRMNETELELEISKKQKEIQNIIQQHSSELLEKDELLKKCIENSD